VLGTELGFANADQILAGTERRSARSPAREELNLKTIVNFDTIKVNGDSGILSSVLRRLSTS
jgi:hypothetical protein